MMRSVKDQNIKRMVNELEIAESALIHTATDSGAAKKLKRRPSTMNNGAPGGCPTSNLYAAVMYSPQSHKLAVDSIVIKYTVLAIRKTSQPSRVFHLV